MNKLAKFNIGECVIHKAHGYRALIADIDPFFQASGHPNPQADKRPFTSRNPWYRLLVDNSSHITYVEECELIADTENKPVTNPNLDNYLILQQGRYRPNTREH